MKKCDIPIKPAGNNSTRMNPNSFARNNLAKGGVNSNLGKSPATTGTAKRK